MNFNDRVVALDIAKGIGILLVIAGHTFRMDWAYPIYAFHLPMFFFITGMLIKDSRLLDTRKFAIHEVKALLIPLLLMLGVSFILSVIVPDWRGEITISKICRDLYSGWPDFAQNSSLWYLISLWFAVMYMAIIYRYVRKSLWLAVLAVVLLAAISLFLPEMMSWLKLPMARLPFKMDTAIVAVVFLFLGFYLRRNVLSMLNIFARSAVVLSLVVVSVILAVVNGPVNMCSLAFGECRMAYFPIALVGVLSLLLLSRYLESLRTVGAGFAFYGRHSLIIFGFQSLLIRTYNLIVLKATGERLVLYGANPIGHQIASFALVSFFAAPLLVFVSLYAKRFLKYE